MLKNGSTLRKKTYIKSATALFTKQAANEWKPCTTFFKKPFWKLWGLKKQMKNVAEGKISVEKKEPLVLHKECDSIFKVRKLDSKYSNLYSAYLVNNNSDHAVFFWS